MISKAVGSVRKVVRTVLKVLCLAETTPVFLLNGNSGDLLFSRGHGLASGEKAELLVQFGQADAGGLVSVVFQRLETWPSRLAAFLGMRAAGVERATTWWVERRRWISG